MSIIGHINVLQSCWIRLRRKFLKSVQLPSGIEPGLSIKSVFAVIAQAAWAMHSIINNTPPHAMESDQHLILS